MKNEPRKQYDHGYFKDGDDLANFLNKNQKIEIVSLTANVATDKDDDVVSTLLLIYRKKNAK